MGSTFTSTGPRLSVVTVRRGPVGMRAVRAAPSSLLFSLHVISNHSQRHAALGVCKIPRTPVTNNVFISDIDKTEKNVFFFNTY